MTANDIPHDWPESLRELAFATGADAVNALLERWAGQRVYLRLQTLAPVVGELAAKKILRARGSGFFDVPKASSAYRRQRDAEIIERHGKGETISALAGASGLTPRAVRGIVQAHRSTTTRDHRPMTTTYFAHDCIATGDGTFRRGDKLPPMDHEALQALLDAGVASHEPPPAPEPLPTVDELLAASREDRRHNSSPTFTDWLALVVDFRRATGGARLKDADRFALRETWQKLPANEQRNTFQQLEQKLSSAGRAGFVLVN